MRPVTQLSVLPTTTPPPSTVARKIRKRTTVESNLPGLLPRLSVDVLSKKKEGPEKKRGREGVKGGRI